MQRPELKQFGDLKQTDLDRFPVWVSCHSIDYDQPWYDDTDEETFRPWIGKLPVDPSQDMFLVRATAMLADNSSHPAFLTPSSDDYLGTIQPQIFVGDEFFGFWGGMFGIQPEERQAFYQTIGRSAQDVFPARFSADSEVATELCSVTVEGFYKTPDLRKVEVEQ